MGEPMGMRVGPAPDTRLVRAGVMMFAGAEGAAALAGVSPEFLKGAAVAVVSMASNDGDPEGCGLPDAAIAAMLAEQFVENLAAIERYGREAELDEMAADPVAAAEEIMRELEDE